MPKESADKQDYPDGDEIPRALKCYLITREVRGQDSRRSGGIRRRRLALRAGTDMGLHLHPKSDHAQTGMRHSQAGPHVPGCTRQAEPADIHQSR